MAECTGKCQVDQILTISPFSAAMSEISSLAANKCVLNLAPESAHIRSAAFWTCDRWLVSGVLVPGPSRVDPAQAKLCGRLTGNL